MPTPVAVASLILASIIGTLILWYINEPAVRGTVTFVDRIRGILGALFLGLIAYHLIRSGNIVDLALAGLGFAFLTGWFLVERPDKNTI